MPGDTASEIALEIIAAYQGGAPVIVATVIVAPAGAPTLIGAKILMRTDGAVLGALDGDALDSAVKAMAQDALGRRGVETLYLSADARRVSRQDAVADASYQVMIEVHERPATLLVIGGGHVGKALATIGHLCGFAIEVVDDRPQWISAERFPEADRITCGRFEDVLRDYPIDSNTYVVCVTRGHKHDETSLRLVAASPAPYVGMIGSKRRVRAVLKHLIEEGLDRVAAERVQTPIGLDIGAETPEEIAVSIIAEIIQARRGGTGESMRDTMTPRRGVAPAERLPDAPAANES
jgi:xanthine dehydrogenase accessory factor